ncbi:DNA polymerase I [bacterium]|nr:DNA polymerase I [bacterium]
MTKKRLFLIDGNAYIHRAFHALPPFTTSRGEMVNAVYGFIRMLLKTLKKESPDYMAVCFDYPAPTFRHKEYREYKATRKKSPDELKNQIPLTHEIVRALNLALFEKEGYEADDLIATLSERAKKEGIETVIVTGDKDALQLVDKSTSVLNEPKNILYDEKEVKERIGVTPEQITDFMALMGDQSDNVPGVRGVGPKTATQLIQKYGNIENLYHHLDEIEGKLKERLKDSRENAFLSKRLVILERNVPLKYEISHCKIKPPKREELLGLLHRLEFRSLIAELVTTREEKRVSYSAILSKDDLEKLLKDLGKAPLVSVDFETTGKDPMVASLVGISLSLKPFSAYYIPLTHSYLGVPKQLDRKYVLGELKPILENERIRKYGQNIKYEIILLKRAGIDLKGIYFDTMVASYLLNPAKLNHNLGDIAIEYLGHKMTPIGELIGKGKKEITMDQVEIERVTPYACADADIVLRLAEIMEPKLKEKGLEELFHKVEMPLVGILAEMEMDGVLIDKEYLGSLSKEFALELKKLEKKIYSLAGEEFNINSPKQLSYILFEKLKLPVIEKTKTGYSTKEAVLRELAPNHKLPNLLIKYRELAKLKSTYIDALPLLINSHTGRVHTSFNQTITATGRLSSSEPNLQNIPIRTELGRKIRKAFIPQKGYILLSADYSQIDLRVLAHISKDEALRDAFFKDEDIHSRTACEIFGLSKEEVTPELRRMAKTVNFGLSYGMSPFGLSRDLGISLKEAEKYITKYFERYSGVKKYIEEIIEEAKKKGYVTTLLKRRRYIPEINHPDPRLSNFAKRAAINTPIQGTSADIIKVAMLEISERIKKEALKTKMIIQIHDELLFEVPEDEVGKISRLAKEIMEGAIELEVPIRVDIKTGRNWAEIQ